MDKIPIIISACCVTVYWLTVLIKSIFISGKIGKDPNVLPREPVGKVLRFVWFPTIITWIILLWRGTWKHTHLLFHVPSQIILLATVLVVASTLFTFWCWHLMGRSWRIGIDPSEKTQLIVTGPYKYVLHPIYGLSMVLSIATFFVLPSFIMLIIISIHVMMLHLEARREEKYLLSIHGECYRQYQQSVGRFLPIK